MKNSVNKIQIPPLVVPPELEFNAAESALEFGLPTTHETFMELLDINPNFDERFADIDNRLRLLKDEIEFQVNRLTEVKIEEAVAMTPSLLAMTIVARLETYKEKLKKTIEYETVASVKYEDYQEGLLEHEVPSLPSGAEALQIVKQVINTSPFKPTVSKADPWRRILQTSYSGFMIVCGFWWMFLEATRKQKGDTADMQAELEAMMTQNFKELQLLVDQFLRGLFVKNYPEFFAKCIYVGFLEAFPKEIAAFNSPQFKDLLIKNASKWSSGFALQHRTWRKWDVWSLCSKRAIPFLRQNIKPEILGDVRYDLQAFEMDLARVRREEAQTMFSETQSIRSQVVPSSSNRGKSRTPTTTTTITEKES